VATEVVPPPSSARAGARRDTHLTRFGAVGVRLLWWVCRVQLWRRREAHSSKVDRSRDGHKPVATYQPNG